MTQISLPPPPINEPFGSQRWVDWIRRVFVRLSEDQQLLWEQIDKSGSSVSDFTSNSHQLLTSILVADDTSTDTTQNRHVSDSQMKTVSDHIANTSNPHSVALSQLVTRPHSDLTSILTADDTSTDATRNKHVSNNDMKANTDHRAATNAHGATGDIVGTGDAAQAATRGVVYKATAVSDASASAVSVASADVSAAPASYNSTWGGEVVTLSNEMKGDINQLVTDVNAIKDTLNTLLANLRTSGTLST